MHSRTNKATATMCGLWLAHCTLQNITICWFFILFFLASSFLRSFALVAGAFLFVDFANYKISWQWTSMRMNSAEITTNVKRKNILPCVSLCSEYQHTNVCLSFFLSFFLRRLPVLTNMLKSTEFLRIRS